MSFVVLLTGCAYSTTTNAISYHGTDLQNTAEPFTYVAKDVIGTAQTSYTWRGGGNTRNGLIADAFKDLNRQFNLSVNQAFANVAIDWMETESGTRTPLFLAVISGVQYFPEVFKITASVRADVIEFNSDKEFTTSAGSKKMIPIIDQSPPTDIGQAPDMIGKTEENESQQRAQRTQRHTRNKFKVGEIVLVQVSGNWVEGKITSIQKANNTARVEYKAKNSRKQGEYFFLHDMKYPE